MPRYPVKAAPRVPVEIDHDTVDVIGPAVRRHGFISFRYSSTEVSSTGGSTRVRSRSATFEDGKLTQESFDGELPASAYADMVGQAQQQFARQTELLLKSLSLLLPFARRRDRE